MQLGENDEVENQLGNHVTKQALTHGLPTSPIFYSFTQQTLTVVPRTCQVLLIPLGHVVANRIPVSRSHDTYIRGGKTDKQSALGGCVGCGGKAGEGQVVPGAAV